MIETYRHRYEVRYDECDLFGWLTPAAILRYLQDIASLDADRTHLANDTGIWVARRTVIEFGESLPARTVLEAETYPVGLSKVTAHRGYVLRIVAPEGGKTQPEPVVQARTLWVYLDQRGRPTRLPADIYAYWQPGETIPPPREETTWPRWPERPPYQFQTAVRFSDLDVMGHVNNAAYVELLDNAAWQVFGGLGWQPGQAPGYPRPLHYDIEYLESVLPGEALSVSTWFQPFPEPGHYERLELIERSGDGKKIARARSLWRWQPDQHGQTPDVTRLWN